MPSETAAWRGAPRWSRIVGDAGLQKVLNPATHSHSHCPTEAKGTIYLNEGWDPFTLIWPN